MTDNEKGLFVVKAFYNKWKGYANSFGISFEQLVTILKSRRPMGGEAFISGLGNAVKVANISDSKIVESMGKLAAASQGKIPKANMDFFNALNGVAISYNFVDAVSFVAVESSKDILKGAETMGNTLIRTGKILNFLFPALAIFGLFIFLNQKSNGAILKTIKDIRK